MSESDRLTADAFATSWNNIDGVYGREQFLDWMAPVDPKSWAGRDVLELGFGNGSLLAHAGAFGPRRLAGVELGDTMERTRRNLAHLDPAMLDLRRGDLTRVDLGPFDFVYCIGVLHHLKDPHAGFQAVLRHVRPGGRFHCWVYAREGNAVVRLVVEPVRRIVWRLPWWFTKHAVALPLVLPFFAYAKLGRLAPALMKRLPLGEYALWIAPAPFRFFHHVAFDQLVTPQTAYIDRATIERWLADPRIQPGSTYVIFRNGNSWKFGGTCRTAGGA